MDNPNIDNQTPKKEEYVIILDYLKFGYVNPERPNAHGKPIAQAIGVDKFTLIEVTPKEGVDLDIHDKVYIGSGKRDKVNRVKGLLDFENLTATSRIELEYAIKEIISEKEDIYIKFFNEIDSLNIKMHKLELIPGIGKKHTQMILEERKKEPFKNFEDLKQRVPLLGEPVDMLAKRVRLELDTTTVKRGKNKYYMFTLIPGRHPANKKKRNNKGRNNRGRNNRGRGRKPNRNNKNKGNKPQNKPSSENKE
jgi:putative nucleotide binding protein